VVRCAGCLVYRKVDDGYELLLATRDESKKTWELPRGKLLEGETPRAAAAREVKEETGVRVRAGAELGSYAYPIGKSRYKMVQFFAATPISGSPTPDNKEFIDVSWFTFGDATPLLAERERVLVDSLEQLLVKRAIS
jgi:8-oxo-dGTP pyrophosphatase MutT (NUDIX family)